MAFEKDDAQERAWIRWFSAGTRIETKRRVAGGARHIDVVVWGKPSFPPLSKFLPAGTIGVENLAPGTTIESSHVIRLNARMAELIERHHDDRETVAGPDDKAPLREPGRYSGLLIGSGIAESVRDTRWWDSRSVYQGVEQLTGAFVDMYVWNVDQLDSRPPHVPWILFFGSEERVEDVLADVGLDDVRPYLFMVYLR